MNRTRKRLDISTVVVLLALIALLTACESTSLEVNQPTATLAATPSGVVAVSPAPNETGLSALAGRWRIQNFGSEDYFGPPTDKEDWSSLLEITPSGHYTWSVGDGLAVEPMLTGTWTKGEDGVWVAARSTNILAQEGNLLYFQIAEDYFSFVYYRERGDGSLQPYEPDQPVQLPRIAASDLITLSFTDLWTGLSPAAPIDAIYRFGQTSDGLIGNGELSVGGYHRNPITQTVPLTLPLPLLDELLTRLAALPMESGVYRPSLMWTDDYPTLALQLHTTTGDWAFTSNSQGPLHIPWQVHINGEDYVTYSPHMMQVIESLYPYLARDQLDALVNHVINTPD